jgi:autotransporter-associated beta strand protein
MKNPKLTPWTRFVGSVTALVLIPMGTMPRAFAVDQIWTNAGLDALWSTSGNWTTAVPGSGDNVFLPVIIPVGGSTLTLGAGSLANALSFKNNYTLTGGDLTLTTGGVRVDLGYTDVINSQLLGTSGLTLTGGGSLRLTNALNGYTGTTSINNGSIIINSEAALGGTGTVSILTTNNTPSNVNTIGFGGGSLVLDGTAGGFTFSRDINFEGRGPIGDRGAAIQSLGNNTLSGVLTSAVSPLTPATVRNSRINSVNGTLTISGTLNVGGTVGTTITSLGGVNTAGVGNFSFAGGTLSGTGTLEKSGSGTLFLNGNATGFTGAVRTAASSIGQQSSIRVTQTTVGGTSVFGAGTGSGTSAQIDLNGGVLEFRSNSNLDFNALTTGKNVYLRASTVVYSGPAGGGDAVNGQTTLGLLRVAQGQTATFRSRNGFGATLQAWTQESSNGNTAIANEMGGTLTFAGDAWNNADASSRDLTFSGNGNTRIVGNITASGTDKRVIKQGTGELILNGTAGTFTGGTFIQGGAVRITDFRSINNNTQNINLGNATTTAGALIIGGTGTGTATAAGLTTSKTILWNVTTSAQSAIYANQALASPVILNGAITSLATTATNFNLGGSNTQDNIINVALPAGTTAAGLTKVGSGTWVLNAANLYAGATTIQAGTLKLRATAAASNVILQAATNTIVFSSQATAQTAGGTLEFRGFAGAATTETLGALTPTAGAATVRLLGNGAAANLTFTSLGATTAASSVNFDTSGAIGGVVTLTGLGATTATNLPGTANFQGHLYINGADFATTNAGGVLQAPTYAAAGNFQNAATALVGAVHNKLTGSFTNAAATVSSLVTNNQTLTLSGDLVVSTGGILQSGGPASILSDSATPRLIQGGAAGTNIAIRVNLLNDVLNLGNATNPVNIASVTTGGLTKNGAGTLVVFGTNAQTGTTTINEGKVALNGAAARLSATSESLVIRQGASLELLAGVTDANAVVNALDGSGTISGLSGQTFTQNGGGTWNGVFSGGMNVTKGGAAATWSGLNTYTGVTTIGGTGLVTVDTLANGGVSSGIGASSNAAANLVFTGSTAGIDYRGSIIDTALTLGSRSATTDRLFTLGAVATGANLTSSVSNNNAIIWSNTGAIVNNTTANATLTFAGASTGDNTFNPQLVDSSVGGGVTLAVTKSGTGQWNLGNSNNTYTGATTIAEGTLGLNDNGALPANSPLVLGTAATSGILQMSGSFARTLSASATAGTGSITFGGTAGGGFAAHSTALTVTLDGGTGLTWGSGGFVPTGAALILNSTSSLADVTFTNAIDLGAASRTVTVNDNGNTGADYANLTGVLSGAGGGLFKNGTGILRLGNLNTYSGTTSVDAGTLVVSSLGSSTGGATSSVGAGGVAMDNANALILGNATTTGGNLVYVGAGETSDRKIRLRGTTANNAIYADGAGALILTNVAHDTTETGNKTLSLRGTSAAGNMITSQLSNNVAGVLSVTLDGGATWILTNPANNYTGATTVGAGALGIGDNSALGTGTLTFSNGNVFAHGADRTVANPITHANNTTAGFLGDYSLTFGSSLNLAAAANNVTTTNSIVAGEALTFAGGVTANALTDNRAWVIDGTGETIVNGAFTTTTGNGVRFDVNGGGTLTLGTNGASSNFNAGSVLAVDVDRGTLKFNTNNAIPTTFTAAASPTTAGTAIAATTYTVASTAGLLVGQTFSGTNVPTGSRIVSIDSPTTFTTNLAPTTAVASGVNLTFRGSSGVTLTPELVNADIATIDLNGTNQMITGLTATTDGAVVIDNTSATPAALTFGANNSVVSISNTGARTITDSGAGALSIIKTGNTALTLPTGMTLTYQGSTSSTGGGSFTINSALNGTTGLIATGSSTLTLAGGLTTPAAVTSVNVGNGSTLSLLDGAGSKINALTSLTLGTSGGTNTFLNLNVGDSLTAGDGLNTDTLSLVLGGALNLFPGNKVTFNLTDTGLNANQSYTLLDATAISGGLLTGPLTLADYVLGGTPGGFTTISLSTSTDNKIILNTGNLISGSSYFAGVTNNTWNGAANNWADDKAGAIASTTTPGQGTDVIFRADNAVTPTLATTLEQNFKINSLTFEASTVAADTPTSISIAPGTVATNRLELAPQLPTAGLNVPAGGTPLVTISAPVRATGNQTWSVAEAAALTGATYATASTTVNVPSTAGLRVGMTVAGPGIPAGATVVSISAGSFVISAPTTAAAATAVTVNATSLVSMTGGLSGAGNITKNGAGKVAVSGTSSYTGSLFTMNAGQFEFSSGTTLGGIIATPGAGALVELTGGVFYVSNATSTTVSNNLILSGGTLSAGGNNQTYSGSASLAANSNVDLLDPVTRNNGRTITLSGVLSGTAGLTVDSISTVTAGNQFDGSLNINNGNSTWNGALNINRGTVVFTNVAGSGIATPYASNPGDVNFNQFGRVIYRNIDGATLNRTGTLNYAASAVGEFQVDNVGALASNYTINQIGLTTIGAGAAMRVFLADAASALNIGDVSLTGTGSISVAGGDADSFVTISGVISDGGGAFGLDVNNDLGAWVQTNTLVRLNGLNTFTGALGLSDGVLEFSTVTNISGGPSNLGAGSIINLGGGTLRFIGGTSMSTDRPITQTGSATLAANGTGGATMTYTGAVAGGASTLTLDGTGEGILNGAVTQTAGGTNDLTKNGTGTWSLNATNTLADDILVNAGTLNINVTQAPGDDIVITGAGTIVNINAVNAHQGDDLFIRNGAVVNLGVNGALGAGMDALNIAENAAAAATATLDLKGFTSTVPAATTIGFENSAVGEIVSSVGNGVLTSGSYVVRNGSVASSVTLAGAGGVTKNGAGIFTLRSINTFTGASVVTEGQLVLDYSTNNTSKIAAAAGLTLGGAAGDANPLLTFSGNATAASTQAFTTLTLINGASDFVPVSNGGQAMNVNFTTITRTAAGGTVDFTLPAVGSITTTQALANGILGGYATVSNGAAFASKDGSNNIIPLVATAKDAVGTWLATDNVIDTTGYSGTLAGCAVVNSITFSQPGSTVVVGGKLGITTGGVLVTSGSTGAGISGGQILAATPDLIVHQQAAGDFTLSSAVTGTLVITKTGTGGLLLSGANTSTGGVNITEGIVKVSGGNAIGDTAPVNFKDVAGSGLTLLANETVGNLSGNGAVASTLALGSNTLTVNQTTALNYSGSITGNGTLVKQGTANLVLNGVSPSFNGPVVVNQGPLFASGANLSNLPSISSLTVNSGGAFLVDNNGSNPIPDRVNNAAGVTLRSLGGGGFFGVHIRGDQDVSANETFGTLTLAGGSSGIAVNQNGGTNRTAILTFASLVRQDNATIFLNGRNLAATTGNNRGRITFTTAPTLVGGTGVAQATTAVTNVPIIRFGVSLLNTVSVALTDVPNTFASYNANGVVPLNITTEYRLDSTGYGASADATDNLRFTTGTTGLATKTFNAVVYDSSAAAMTVSGAGGGGNVLTVGSGAMLFTSTVLANGTTLNGFDTITPGTGSSNEWIITVANTTATIGSVLTDGAAATLLTKSGSGTLILGADNTYTGGTVFNQGVVQADTLARLGTAGDLRFNGGTLRFGGVFDPTLRSVVIGANGAVLDTNANNITLANVMSGTGTLTKVGTGILTLNAASTYTGSTTVSDGTLQYGIAAALPVANAVTVNGAAAVLDLGAHAVSLGAVTLASGSITGTGSLAASSLSVQGGSIAPTLLIGGSTGILKTGTSTLTLTGANTFSGQLVVADGVVSFDSIANADGTASALGAPTTAAAGAIRLGAGTTAGTLTYTGSGHTSNRAVELGGNTGGGVLDADGTGALVIGAVSSEEMGAKTLTLRGSSGAGIVNRVSSITECYGTLTLAKLDASIWQIDAVSTYSGATQIDDGTLRIGAANVLPATTAVRLGTGTTAGVLDLNGFDQTIGSLSVQTNNNTVTNQILVGAGKTLTINGAVTLGIDANAADTNINASGGGAIVVNSGGANFIVGAATGGTNDSRVDADFSGLNSFTANLGAGIFRLGDVNTGTEINPSTFKLAVNNTITASAIRVGDGVGGATTHVLTLGSGANTLNTDTLNVGSAGGATVRSSGTVVFDLADTTGTVQVRASDGTGRSTVNMANTTTNTGGDIVSTVNLAGHTADILASTLTMASRTAATGAATATLTFDQGTLDVTTLNMASRTGAGTGNATATLNLGDSAAPGSPTTTIGTVNMAVNTSAGGTVTSNMVITGGTVNIGTGSGTAINMANAAASRTSVSSINLTGGTLSATGNIVRTGGAGTETATTTVNGGTLNMNGNSIGTAGAQIALQAQSGTLSGLSELNGGGLLTKSTTGALSMGNGNTYTGGTLVSDGTLLATNSTGSATGSGAVTVAAAGTLGGTGSIIAASGNNITINGTLDAGMPTSSSGSALALTVGGAGSLALSGTTLFQLFTNDNLGTLNGVTAADRVVVNAPNWSNVVFGGSSSLTITTGLTATTFVAGDSWRIFDWTGVAAGTAPLQGTNGFNSIIAPTLDVNLDWDYSNLFTTGTISVIVIPEPSRALLLMLGLLGLMMRRRRN